MSLANRRFIARLDYARAKKCWWVRFQPEKISKTFLDSKYGGKRKALAAAIAFRDEALSKLHRDPRTHSSNKRNTTGVIGVSYVRYRKRAITGVLYWIENYYARYMNDGKQVGRSFSIKKYGRQGAFILACRARSARR